MWWPGVGDAVHGEQRPRDEHRVPGISRGHTRDQGIMLNSKFTDPDPVETGTDPDPT